MDIFAVVLFGYGRYSKKMHRWLREDYGLKGKILHANSLRYPSGICTNNVLYLHLVEYSYGETKLKK